MVGDQIKDVLSRLDVCGNEVRGARDLGLKGDAILVADVAQTLIDRAVQRGGFFRDALDPEGLQMLGLLAGEDHECIVVVILHGKDGALLFSGIGLGRIGLGITSRRIGLRICLLGRRRFLTSRKGNDHEQRKQEQKNS